MFTVRRALIAPLAAVAVGAAATAAVAETGALDKPATATTHTRHCSTWSETLSFANRTGRTVTVWDQDGALPRHLVAVNATVTFTDTIEGDTATHTDVLYDQAADATSGVGHELIPLHRPAAC